MQVRSRRAVAVLAALCWITVAIFCIAGIMSGFGFTSNMGRLFDVVLSGAAVLTITAVVGHAITPLTAGRGIGARAAMRAARDGEPQGRHAKDDTDARVYDFGSYQ